VAGRSLTIADNGVDNTIVRAPFAGVVTAKAAQPGEIVSPLATGGFTRTGIGTIVDMDSLEVEVDVGEAYIGRVQAKMPAEVVLNAYPDWRIPAEVIAIIPAADRGKATVKVRVALKVKDPRIVPDMGVRVSFLEKPREAKDDKPQGVRVPAAALAQRDGKTVAFTVGEDGKVPCMRCPPASTWARTSRCCPDLPPAKRGARPAGFAEGRRCRRRNRRRGHAMTAHLEVTQEAGRAFFSRRPPGRW
jgi:multidrug efflux pump subunit AcrA (membrane-fusion protein)